MVEKSKPESGREGGVHTELLEKVLVGWVYNNARLKRRRRSGRVIASVVV